MKTDPPRLEIPSISLRDDRARSVPELARACRDYGFFLLRDHGLPTALTRDLEELSARFFARPESEKMTISMDRGGLAWRGFFPVGGELTSGKPDLKEGLYFGEELSPSDARVLRGTPLHGANLFPELDGFRETTLRYMNEVRKIGDRLMELLSLSLELPEGYFHEHYTREPTQLFRVFHYPPAATRAREEFPWGVGEHTDYGLLTLLKQDSVGGLEVKVDDAWVSVPADSEALVCNLGDMLDYLTGGYYRSAPHRVRNDSGRERYSFPFFYDPAFSAPIRPLPHRVWTKSSPSARWDGKNLYEFKGTYGDYLLGKVAKVFPELASSVISK